MADTCHAEWCVALPVPGSRFCAIHQKQPTLHNLEKPHAWRTRTKRERAAAQRAAERAAESDTKLADRKR